MFKSSTALLLALALAIPAAWAQQPDPAKQGNVLQIQPDAPDRYVVQKGDTLWGISGKFLREPWRWPEIWRLNKDQIRNPHLIYPGNVVVLDRATGRLAVVEDKLSPRVREQAIGAEAIPTIPAKVIEPFLAMPLVVELGGLDSAPRIVAAQEGRYYLGAGNVAYASGLGDGKQAFWNVYRQGMALVDPETKETLGYEAIYLGTARVRKPGDPSTLEITSAMREIGPGDRLVAAAPSRTFSYVPRAPERDVRGQVMSRYDGNTDLRSQLYGGREDRALRSNYGAYSETGLFEIVTVNRGARHGLEQGHVLALSRSTTVVNDRSMGPFYMGDTRPENVELPVERYGLVMVFRVFENMSYALVVQSQRPVAAGDLVTKP